MAYETINTDSAEREVIATGATREESILTALRKMDLPDGYDSYDAWFADLKQSANGYEAVGIATSQAQ